MSSKPMLPASLYHVRWALKWYTDTTDTIVLDGAVILRWIEGLDLSSRSKQSIYNRTRNLYQWMAVTYQFAGGIELPILDPVQFGRRKKGEKRGSGKRRRRFNHEKAL